MLASMDDTATATRLEERAGAAWAAHEAELLAAVEEKRTAAIERAGAAARAFIDELVRDAADDLEVTRAPEPVGEVGAGGGMARMAFAIDGIQFRTTHPGPHSRPWTELELTCPDCTGTDYHGVGPVLHDIGARLADGIGRHAHAEGCPHAGPDRTPRIAARLVRLTRGAGELEELLTSILNDRHAGWMADEVKWTLTAFHQAPEPAVLVTWVQRPDLGEYDPTVEPF